MPNNTGYPGVDPDGKLPGGLEIAGNVEAGSFSALGVSITPSTIAMGSWSRGANQSILADGSQHQMILDTETAPLSGVTLNLITGELDIVTGGLYLLYGDVSGAASWVAGYIRARILGTITNVNPVAGALSADASDLGSALAISAGVLPPGDSVRLMINNVTGSTADFVGDLVAVRLS